MCVCICLIFSVSQGASFMLICPFVAVLWKVCPCLFIFTFHVFCCYNMNVNNFNIIDFTISKVHQMKLEHKTYCMSRKSFSISTCHKTFWTSSTKMSEYFCKASVKDCYFHNPGKTHGTYIRW